VISEELSPILRYGWNPIESQGQENLEKNAVWVIDPLDGTTNFSLGLHYWGVSIARLVGGFPEIAAIYFPLIDELYTAQKGKGASLNTEHIYARPAQKGYQRTFFSCCSRTHKYYDVRVRYKTRILGSAAYDLCTVARGVSVLGFQATPKIWDIAAAWLIVEEAGGVIETHDGSNPFPIEAERDYNQQIYPTLAASNRPVLIKGREWIKARS
jgi:myo-inositol-1(or 4)-monophosphatase